jgi:copper chaperone CopZ
VAQKKIPIEIEIDTREARRAVKDLNRELSDTEGDLEGVESAGKMMARALEQATADMISELEDTRRAVDALERALGPDFDADTTDVVADLKAIGLTAQDIEQDAEELATALRGAGNVKIRAQELGFDDVDKALGRTTESSRVTSTAIGGIGNSISELPGIGSLGPVAESMGMLAENALEGEANLKGLIVAGGGLAAVGLGVQLVQGHFEKMAEIDAWKTEQITEWTDAIYDAEGAVSALADTYRNTGTVEVKTLVNGVQDITSELARSNITIDEWTAAVQGGNRETQDIALKLKAAGIAGDQAMNVITGLTSAQDLYRQATIEAAERTAVFGAATDTTRQEVADLRAELGALPGQTTVSVSADLRDANAQLDSLIRKLDRIGAKSTTLSVLSAGRFRQSHTGSRFEAGEAKAIIPGEQIFVPDGPGRMFSPAESQRMLGGGAPNVTVKVMIDGQELRGVVRTEIEGAESSTVAALRGGVR